MAMPSPTSAIRNWTTIETSVTYVSNQTSVNVLRIEATRHEQRHRHRRERAEDEEQDDERSQPADHRLEQDARSVRVAARRRPYSGSWPVRWTVVPEGAARFSAARVGFSVPTVSKPWFPSGKIAATAVCRSFERYMSSCVLK